MAKYILMIETGATADELHEALCLSAYEGVAIGNAPDGGDGLAIQDIQVVGIIEKTISREEATPEQRAIVEGSIQHLLGKEPN